MLGVVPRRLLAVDIPVDLALGDFLVPVLGCLVRAQLVLLELVRLVLLVLVKVRPRYLYLWKCRWMMVPLAFAVV